MHLKNINRCQALGIHIGISLLLFLLTYCLIQFVWYPKVFMNFGGWQGIKLTAGVDFVLGPLLTLVIYNPLKKSLKWDLTAIGCVQIGCLIAGMWAVYQQRPIAQVLTNNGIYINTTADYKEPNAAKEALNNIEGINPKAIFLKLPEDPTEAIMFTISNEFESGMAIDKNTAFYQSQLRIPDDKIKLRLKSFPFDEANQCHWLPVNSNHFIGEACLNARGNISKVKPS